MNRLSACVQAFKLGKAIQMSSFSTKPNRYLQFLIPIVVKVTSTVHRRPLSTLLRAMHYRRKMAVRMHLQNLNVQCCAHTGSPVPSKAVENSEIKLRKEIFLHIDIEFIELIRKFTNVVFKKNSQHFQYGSKFYYAINICTWRFHYRTFVQYMPPAARTQLETISQFTSSGDKLGKFPRKINENEDDVR